VGEEGEEGGEGVGGGGNVCRVTARELRLPAHLSGKKGEACLFFREMEEVAQPNSGRTIAPPGGKNIWPCPARRAVDRGEKKKKKTTGSKRGKDRGLSPSLAEGGT